MTQEPMDYVARQRLDGRVALVTGGARGIGAASADALAQLGAHVCVSDLEPEAARATADRLKRRGGSAEACALDIADEETLGRTIADLAARHGRLDVLVANAGIGARMPAETMPSDVWNRVVSINLNGTFFCCREAGKAMLEAQAGAIVIVASIMGLVGGGLYPNAAYQATKGALVNLTRTLALEWADRGVRVNAVAPTFARTRLTEGLLEDEAMTEAIIENTPMGRFAEPDEVAAAVAFLASDAASMITGVTLPVDGGWVAR